MPWVNYARQKMRDDDYPDADDYLNCKACMRRCNRERRALFACGWLPAKERGPQPLVPANLPGGLEPTVCAGYSSSLPEVHECGRAMAWRDKGCLPDMYHGDYPNPALRDGIDILSVEQAAVDAHRIKKAGDR